MLSMQLLIPSSLAKPVIEKPVATEKTVATVSLPYAPPGVKN